MSAEERNRELVEKNTKQLVIPTFNKKEIEGIVIETAKKEDVPLGYQIIDLGDVEDNATIPSSKDSELLKQIAIDVMNNGIIRKPILLRFNDVTSELIYCGFATIKVNKPDGFVEFDIIDSSNTEIVNRSIYYDGSEFSFYITVATIGE